MAITPLPSSAPAGAVGSACAELDSLAETLWSARRSEELVDGVAGLQALKAKTAAVEAELLAELDVRQTARKELHWGSTADWFTHLAGTARRAGKKTVVHAKQLTGERRATLAGLWSGMVSPDQAHVILEAIGQLPKAEHVRRRGEQVLIEQAGNLNATELFKAGRHLARVVDPDREEREVETAMDREERSAHLDRFFTVTEDGLGGVRVKGRGSVEDGATLRAALLPLTKPEPKKQTEGGSCEAEEDPRDQGARTWDALIGLGQHSLNTDLAPESHGARPRVSVTIDAETFHGPTTGPTDGPTGSDDGPDQGCDHHQGTAGVGVTKDGLEVPGSVVRRWACDCDLTRVLLDTEGSILDVGRTQRLVTAAIWIALVARDLHCAFPGCTRPPVMCHAHHIRHWINGGNTSLDNLVLLCGHHHRTIHQSPWKVRLGADGRAEFLPPPKPGRPPPTWTRYRPRRE